MLANTAALFAPGELDSELKSDSSPEREQSFGYEGGDLEPPDGSKKRKRKPYRPGEHTPVHWLLSASLCLTIGACLRHWGLHGASAWGEVGCEPHQAVQERLVRTTEQRRR